MMSGHSKWANIKHRKASQDAKKGKVYARFAREIMMAAKLGGGDPDGNFRLRTAIERAKSAGLPNDNIQRSIDNGTGGSDNDGMESVVYEGYGPGGVAVYIETMTDNRHRTVGDIRSYFNKFDGNLGSDGCVAWMFKEAGLIVIPQGAMAEEALFDKAIEAGADDFMLNADEGVYEIQTAPDTLNTVCQALQAEDLAISSAEITRIPENTVEITDPAQAKALLRLLGAIETQDDVQAVHANVEMDDALVESATS